MPATEQLPLEQLEDRLCTLAGRIAAATAEFLRLLGEFDEREGWAGPGVRSCAHWLSWRCGMALYTARDHVRVARRLRRLPVTAATLAEGRLSYSKVRAICRVATPATEAELVEVGLSATAGQVERLTRCIKSVAPEHVPSAPPPQEPRPPRLWWEWQDDGTLRISGRLTAEDGAALLAALGRWCRQDESRGQTNRSTQKRPTGTPWTCRRCVRPVPARYRPTSWARPPGWQPKGQRRPARRTGRAGRAR